MSMCSDTPCVSRVLFKNSGVQVTALKKKKKGIKRAYLLSTDQATATGIC